MKAFDPKGEYTPEEVKAALAGVNGTRQLSFRYERLDKNNKFIENIDYVQSCSIENNSLADIKRTAKFDILDIGKINYLSDRIKPYVRLNMPEKETYASFAKTLSADVWWKMDDPAQTAVMGSTVNIADDTTYSTYDTAFVVSEGQMVYANINPSTAVGKRSIFWAKITLSAPNPVDIRAFVSNSATYQTAYGTYQSRKTVYVQQGTTQDTLVALPDPDKAASYDIEDLYPQLVTYYFKFENVSTSTVSQVQLSWDRPMRIHDSSGNENHALGSGISLQQPATLLDGGKAASISGSVATPQGPAVKCGTAFSGSIWYTAAATLPQKLQAFTTYSTSGAPATYGAGQASMYFVADFSTGQIQLIGQFDVVNYNVTLSKTIGTALKKVRHFAYSMEWREGRFYVWLDGIRHTLTVAEHGSYNAGDNDLSKIPLVNYINRTYITGSTGSSDQNILDDSLMLIGKELSDATARNLYRLGNMASALRKGYVEWPQGVFLLSSPSRKMVDGNTITRKVDGYDQLIALKEDSYDYRYSVPAGVKYTDAIAKILNVRPDGAASIPFTDPAWIRFGGVNITSPTSLVLTDSDINGLPGLGTDAAVTSLGGANVSAKVTVAGTYAEMNFSVQTIKNVSNNLMWIIDSTNLMVIHSQSGSNAGGVSWSKTLYSVPYNATTHAYWRLRESGGTMYWETSSNGTTWNLNYSMATPYDPYTPMNVMFVAGMNGAATGTVNIDNMSLTYGNSQPVSLELNSATLPTTMEWGTGTSKLTIINDLLAAINYTSATYNEHGIFTAGKYISPQNRASSFTYATDSQSVLTGDVDQTMDLFGVPNKWIVVVSEPDRAPLTGTYTNANPNSPTSTVSRGRTIVDFRTEQNAPDQITLDALASRLAFEASQVYEVIEFNTALMPIHQNADVYNLIIDGLVVNSKYAEHSWKMDLSTGSTMSHKVRKVVTV